MLVTKYLKDCFLNFLSVLCSHGNLTETPSPIVFSFSLKCQVPPSLITLISNFFNLAYFKAFSNKFQIFYLAYTFILLFGTRHSSNIFTNIYAFNFPNTSVNRYCYLISYRASNRDTKSLCNFPKMTHVESGGARPVFISSYLFTIFPQCYYISLFICHFSSSTEIQAP